MAVATSASIPVKLVLFQNLRSFRAVLVAKGAGAGFVLTFPDFSTIYTACRL